jgi:hypothetical protein
MATPKKTPAKKTPIKIKPGNVGKLHDKLDIPVDKKIPTATLQTKLAAAKKSGNTALIKQITFALNARKWKK